MGLKYISGNTNREFTIGGFVVPKRNYSQLEIENGKKTLLALSEDQYTKLMESKIFRDLLTTQQITLHDDEPINLLSAQERYANERQRNRSFQQQLSEAEARATEFERLFVEAQKKIAELEALLEDNPEAEEETDEEGEEE